MMYASVTDDVENCYKYFNVCCNSAAGTLCL